MTETLLRLNASINAAFRQQGGFCLLSAICGDMFISRPFLVVVQLIKLHWRDQLVKFLGSLSLHAWDQMTVNAAATSMAHLKDEIYKPVPENS